MANTINEYINYICPIPEFLKKYLILDSLKRLKNIGYFCGMDYASKDIYDFTFYISRFDHSLSTALITWEFTKNKKATLAALFHDITSPCFSHVIDYLNGDYNLQESTEIKNPSIILNDKLLQKFLKEDELTFNDIIDFKKYSIVDSERPKLCADRVDGIILPSLAWTKNLEMKEAFKILDNLEVYINECGEQEIGFKSKEVAVRAKELNDIIDEYTHSKEDYYMMSLLKFITNYALIKSIITYEELFIKDEIYVIDLFEDLASKDTYFNYSFKKFKTIVKEEIPNLPLEKIKNKNLDPLVKGKRLSTILKDEILIMSLKK